LVLVGRVLVFTATAVDLATGEHVSAVASADLSSAYATRASSHLRTARWSELRLDKSRDVTWEEDPTDEREYRTVITRTIRATGHIEAAAE